MVADSLHTSKRLNAPLTSGKVAVAGGARSGVAVACLLKRLGFEVMLSDLGAVSEASIERLNTHDVAWEHGGHSADAMACDWLVLSPGVPTDAPITQTYLSADKPVVSELDVAYWHLREHLHGGAIIAVTGTNGKTTVTKWLSHIWTQAGKVHRVGGNLGTPCSDILLDFMDHPAQEPVDIILEVSSFQLDHMHLFHPDISILLNISEDHLDRYEQSMDAYAASKARLVEHHSQGDTLIYNADDPRCAAIAAELQARSPETAIYPFSSQKSGQKSSQKNDKTSTQDQPGASLHAPTHTLHIQIPDTDPFRMNTNELALPGDHNQANGMAAALAAKARHVKNDALKDALGHFEGVEHRLELVATIDGVRYINDSKATNINAVWYALDSYHEPITLILGGRDKGNDYRLLDSQLRSKGRAIVAIGEAANTIMEELNGQVPDIVVAHTMGDAVREAKRLAKRGEIVLLSPGCSSFDMFEHYEHRGNAFKEEVLSL
ncbi:MAG: UDP-N-acetylmuramoyl-L-alanine--D-glutamate ligase [Balneolaceae bacterium]|nr:UDP-N-acetylmuramoyl-L-alanine--D-glutamate ligase [Balneolaceae bacterium]